VYAAVTLPVVVVVAVVVLVVVVVVVVVVVMVMVMVVVVSEVVVAANLPQSVWLMCVSLELAAPPRKPSHEVVVIVSL
jgi:hypothetical protein